MTDKLKASEIRVNDAMDDLLVELGFAGVKLSNPAEQRVRLTLRLLAQRLLADAEILVNDNYPAPVGGGSWPWPTEVDLTPTRYELLKKIQEL